MDQGTPYRSRQYQGKPHARRGYDDFIKSAATGFLDQVGQKPVIGSNHGSVNVEVVEVMESRGMEMKRTTDEWGGDI